VKPLQLRLCGLHSYREEVTVDFTALGQFGLFGIFGDIGSGKSTLLDGITLALYGVIDRVHGRSRRGIVNHHVDRIEVTFRFAVGEVYEVQRSYRRDASAVAQRVASRICRVEESGALSVIADKEREVNDTVQDLLGLTSEDFMRAVVLPQGRFMEFLHLKGSERRAMLQRIFRLSAYGEGLRSQLRDEKERSTVSLETKKGELRGLGDASAEAVAAAQLRRQETGDALSAQLGAASTVERRFRDANEGRQRHLAHRSAELHLTDHLAHQPQIEDEQRGLKRAETALLVAEPIAAWVAAARELSEAQTHEVEAGETHRDNMALQTTTATSAAESREELARQAPTLQKRIHRLDRAAVLAGQLASIENEAALIEAKRTDENATALALEADNNRHVNAMSTLGDRRAALSTEFSSCQVPSDTRERLSIASQAHQALTRRQQSVEALRQQHSTVDVNTSEVGSCPTCGSVLSAEARREHLKSELERARFAELEAWAKFDEDGGGLTFFDVPNRMRDLANRDRRATEIYPALQDLQEQINRLQAQRETTATALASARQAQALSAGRARSLAEQRAALLVQLRESGQETHLHEIQRHRAQAIAALERLQKNRDHHREHAAETQTKAATSATTAAVAKTRTRAASAAAQSTRVTLEAVLNSSGLGPDTDLDILQTDALTPQKIAALRSRIQGWNQTLAEREAAVRLALRDVPEHVLEDDEWTELRAVFLQSQQALDLARTAATTARLHEESLKEKAARFADLQTACHALELRLGRLATLARVLRGNRFVEFIANDYLHELAQVANRHLAILTADRYALQLDETGSFLVRDEDGGGALRPVTSLSGGETFVASLALALALSSQVQARSTQPLELFFLDEGFGTLDGEALDRVMTAIESLQSDVRTIGVISHVPAVRERVPRYVMVAQPGRDGTGSRLSIHDN
jgi:DNA repair protein SbcC/Rad50